MLEDFLWWGAVRKKMTGRCLCVCMSAQAFSSLEPERLGRSGLGNVHSMRRNGGKTLELFSDRSLARAPAKCHGQNDSAFIMTQGCRAVKIFEGSSSGSGKTFRLRLRLQLQEKKLIAPAPAASAPAPA